jgi:hypothetical protein
MIGDLENLQHALADRGNGEAFVVSLTGDTAGVSFAGVGELAAFDLTAADLILGGRRRSSVADG